MARDIFHPIVREALEKDGWTITHDPYSVKIMGRDYAIDLAAEQIVAAQRGMDKIAIEVKSFVSPSISYEFHTVLGQYLNYHTFMEIKEPERVLYLAVAKNVYNEFFIEEGTQLILNKFSINTIVINAESKTIEAWMLRSKPTR
ncbi:XisH family protein [Spirosoma foliorum]|uniref:XisH family protein n=1 Tax=Spirosoma foliorum TaxID=2710596 RepID=A0A7G5GY50_9BACT|nr:XisH family protein [Spirosoma foliorum]QMW03792.1 XisH family protein [Spirosoma foliorum]